MAEAFKTGDKVSWNYSGDRVHGTVKKVHRKEFEMYGRTHHASEDEPQYEVVSDNGGDPAIHKGSALKRE